jgi:hypothetical protein
MAGELAGVRWSHGRRESLKTEKHQKQFDSSASQGALLFSSFSMRRAWRLATVIAAISACSGSPTGPTKQLPPVPPQVGISFQLANLASLSLSDPILCPGDAASCPRFVPPQSPPSTNMAIGRTYTLAPGTYCLTGVLQPTTSLGASLSIRIMRGTTRQMSGDAIQRSLEVVRFIGDERPAVSVISDACGGDFAVNATGALEWAFVFEVTGDRSGNGICL